MSLVSDIERKVCAMPKAFRDWFAEFYHATCSGEGRQMTDEEIETAMATWRAALSSKLAVGEEEEAVDVMREAMNNPSSLLPEFCGVYKMKERARAGYRALLAHGWVQNSDWLPIESAPKDGTKILLWKKNLTDDYYTMVQASWFEGQWYACCMEDIIDYDDGILNPTHWRPLPPSPHDKEVTK